MNLQETRLKAVLFKNTGLRSYFILNGESSNTIGRAVDNTIIVESDPLVSRQHAVIQFDNEQVTLKDLGSTNGTRLNGMRISEATELVDGDMIIIGCTQFGFHSMTEEPLRYSPLAKQSQIDTVWEA